MIKEDLSKYNPNIIPEIKVGDKNIKDDEIITVKIAIIDVKPILQDRLESRNFYDIKKGHYKDKIFYRDGEACHPLTIQKMDAQGSRIKTKLLERGLGT